MSSSPALMSLSSHEDPRHRPDTTPPAHILVAAEAALRTLAQTWAQDASAGQEAVELFRQTTVSSDTPRREAIHQVALRVLAQAEERSSPPLHLEVLERACDGLAAKIVAAREHDLAAIPVKCAEVIGVQTELLDLLTLQRRLEIIPLLQEAPSELSADQAWLARCSSEGELRQQGRSWLAGESCASGREALWEQFCDILCGHERREFFADGSEERQQQYARFGQRLIALWESYREVDALTASEFMETEEFRELLAGTCHTGWESRLADLEHMLQLARQAKGLRIPLQGPRGADLFLAGAEVAAQWRREGLRDRVLHRVSQVFSLHDERTGAVDAHVLPSLMQTCNEALALGLAPWDREEIWVEQFRDLLLDEGEPSKELSQWFWEMEEGEQVHVGLLKSFEGAFNAASPDSQAQLFEFLIEWYQEERLNLDFLEIPSADLVIMRELEQQLKKGVEAENPQKMMGALGRLAKHVGRPFFLRPSEAAWKQLVRACKGEPHHCLLTRLHLLRHRHPDRDPRCLSEELRSIGASQEPFAAEILQSMNEPAIAQALFEWQRSADPDVWEEFLEKQVPADAASALQSMPDLMARQQTECLQSLLVASVLQPDGAESMRITPFGLMTWAALLGLLHFQVEEDSPDYVHGLARWINRVANRPDHPQSRLSQRQEEFALEIIQQNGLQLEQLPEQFQRQVPVVLAAVKQNGMALQFARGECCRHRGIALAAVRQNPSALERVSHWLRGDREVVREAVRRDGLALRLARHPARSDKAIVLDAVRQNSLALQHAPEHLRADPEIIQAATHQNPEDISD